MEKNSAMYYYHADGLGSIVALTNASGSVAQAYTYDSFGNITSGTPTITQPYTYTGREYDPETGLYFYRARYYDPKAGRFLQRDPIGFKGGINQYVYVSNKPVNFVDPYGLSECIWFGFSGDITFVFGAQLIVQKGKCKNECGEWEWKNRNCACFCVGFSKGWSGGGELGSDSRESQGGEIGLGPISISGGGGGIGAGWKIGAKYCWCDCDII
jgi:RHS repeat-associated protein